MECSFERCGRERYGQSDLCNTHHVQRRKGRPLTPIRVKSQGPCRFEGCDRPPKAKGLCSGHAFQQRSGKPLRPLRSNNRPIGSTRTESTGYISVKTERGWVAEHRYVMQGLLGRALREDEEVHHKNGNRKDNRPQNLELWCRSQPAGARIEDLFAWASEITLMVQELIRPARRVPEILARKYTDDEWEFDRVGMSREGWHAETPELTAQQAVLARQWDNLFNRIRD